MLKESVIRIRDVVHKNATYITVIGDNAQEFDSQARFLIWDDKNEELHSIYANDNGTSQINTPMLMITTTYENIQYIYGYYSHSGFEKMTDAFVVENNLNDTRRKTINNYADGINNFDTEIRTYK